MVSPDYAEGVVADLALGHDVVRPHQVEFVDVGLRREFVDVYGAGTPESVVVFPYAKRSWSPERACRSPASLRTRIASFTLQFSPRLRTPSVVMVKLTKGLSIIDEALARSEPAKRSE
jgi:hypothetical protein